MFCNGVDNVRSVAIVTGGGRSFIENSRYFDCFITGEVPHSGLIDAQDMKVNLIMAGHYETETLGVQALMPLLEERYGVQVVFIDAPLQQSL